MAYDGRVSWKREKVEIFVIEAKEKENHFETEVGPGVYDIHSPRVPSVEENRKSFGDHVDKSG